ncbi:YceI family protein [Pluralibacter gergoviae]
MNSMKKMAFAAVAAASLYVPLSQAELKTYEIDPTHTAVAVSWNHFGFSNPMAFIPNATGEVKFDSANPEKSTVNVTLPIGEINTFVPKLTEEFKGTEYFDVAKYPTATFRSTKVTAKGDDKFEIVGDLTLKGITKPVTLEATLNKQGEQPMMKKPAIGFDASGTIKRSDFKIDKYVPNVSDEIKLTITTEAHSK